MVTFLELRDQARTRSDMTYSKVVSEDELKIFINSSLKELYDLLVSSYADYYTSDAYQFTLTSSDNGKKNLPSDFYKLRGVDRSIDDSGNSSSWYTVNPYNFQQRNMYNQQAITLNTGFYPYVKYKVLGSPNLTGSGLLSFIPEQNSAGLYQIWYVPKCPELVDDDDEVNGVNGWEEYIVVDAAIKMLQKEESDVSILMAEKSKLKDRIESLAGDRDASIAETITDVRSTEWFT